MGHASAVGRKGYPEEMLRECVGAGDGKKTTETHAKQILAILVYLVKRSSHFQTKYIAVLSGIILLGINAEYMTPISHFSMTRHDL